MKKVLKSRIFAFILGAIIFSGITSVAAYSIFANDIGYTPKDSTWEVNNIQDAVDDLFNRVNITRFVDLTSNTSYSNQCFTLKSVIALMDEIDNSLFIKVYAEKNNSCDDNTIYTVDISGLNLKTISYKKNLDLANSKNFYFYNDINSANTNNLVFKADTNYGFSNKTDYNYIIYYNFSK